MLQSYKNILISNIFIYRVHNVCVFYADLKKFVTCNKSLLTLMNSRFVALQKLLQFVTICKKPTKRA